MSEKIRKVKCGFCGLIFDNLQLVGEHIVKEHDDKIEDEEDDEE